MPIIDPPPLPKEPIMIFTKTFWSAAAERAVKTFAQSAAAMLVAGATGLLDTDWVSVLSVAGMAAVVSVLTSVGTGAVTDGNPAIGSPEVLAVPGQDADPIGGPPVEVEPRRGRDDDGDGRPDVAGA